MGNFRILKLARLVLVSLLCSTSGQAYKNSGQLTARSGPGLVRDLVTETLIRGLGAVEVTEVPKDSPACLMIAGVLGPEGTLVVGSTARLLTVEGAVERTTLRQLSIKFGASGLKVGQQLVMLTSTLEWVKAEGGELLALGFERGDFNGFFNGTPRLMEMVKVARAGDELCVAAG